MQAAELAATTIPTEAGEESGEGPSPSRGDVTGSQGASQVSIIVPIAATVVGYAIMSGAYRLDRVESIVGYVVITAMFWLLWWMANA